jgi:hypothetical protein
VRALGSALLLLIAWTAEHAEGLAALTEAATYHELAPPTAPGRFTFMQRPYFWAARLWCRLLETAVLDPRRSRPTLHLYRAQCLRDHTGGVTLLATNMSRSEPASVNLETASERFTLTAPKLENTHVQLNGREFALGMGLGPRLAALASFAGVTAQLPAVR